MRNVLLLLSILCIIKAYAQGQLKFDSTNIEFGTIDKAEPLKATFSFCNIGNAPIEINGVRLSTGKIRIEYPHGLIQPNEKGEIKAVYDIQDSYAGRFKKPIMIKTSNQNETIRLYIAGDISDTPPAKQRRSDGIIWYRIYKEGKYGALNSEERLIIKPNFNTLYYGLDNFVAIEKDKAYLFNKDGKQIFDIECISFDMFHGGYKAENKNKHFAIFDKLGNSIIPFEREYLSIEKYHTEDLGIYYSVKNNNYWALCNTSGDEVFHFNKSFIPYYIKERFVIIVRSDSQENEGLTVWTLYDINGKYLCQIKGGKHLSVYIDDEGYITAFSLVKALISFSDDNNYKEDKYVGTDDYKKVLGNIQRLTSPSKNPLE